MPPLTLLQRNVYFDTNMDLDLAPTDEQTSISADRRRATTSAFNLSPRKSPRKRVEETDPRLAGWTPVQDSDLDQVSALANSISTLDVSLDEEVTKRKRYESDRYKGFGLMARQYDFLKRLKRAGRAHEPDGIATTKPGALAVLCWACPDADRNLPLGWDAVNPNKRSARIVPAVLRLTGGHDDPSLGSGLGYFVESSTYKEHLKNYIKEKDVSHCVAFQAMLQKDTKITKGLRVSGVAGCVCARHGLVRRRGLGDLQIGERRVFPKEPPQATQYSFLPRFANVDWILLCTLWAERLREYGFAYDIICQWMIHFFERLKKIRESDVDTSTLATDIDEADLYFGLPVWHAGAHQAECRAHLALAYMLGMGKTDGEAMERIWATLNPASWATKEMGEGARHDVLEDKIDRMNFAKNLSLGKSLARKLIVAIAERRQQGLEFAELDKSVKRSKREEWRKRVDQWYEDEDTDSPFILAGGQPSGPGQRSIAEELRQAELEDARAGHVPFVKGNMTATAFVQAGLQLEDTQRRIRAALKNKSLTATYASEIQELRISLLKKMTSFERLQLIYMPGVAAIREADDAKSAIPTILRPNPKPFGCTCRRI
ncbi:CxC2 domain-containing protein [Mycena chlorophos]|uniref:CxC2 domain-containing protein n=1 Tax=Mycena chlorophos TaxID=658473 RepID=A0A8H6VSB0_MYCCL|nr:CxC2 domain-containing protein [Mycena chlorophos]